MAAKRATEKTESHRVFGLAWKMGGVRVREMRRWREPIGTVVSIMGLVAWVWLGVVVVSRVADVALEHPTVAWCVFCFLVAIVAAGGLFIFWVTAEQADFWRRGYRVRQLGPKGFFHWSLGPKQCVYEERAPGGQIQGLPYVRTILGDGYPAPCEVCLPREEDWDAQMPSWARGRRTQIKERMHKCFGAERSGTRFVDPG
jgi:hypothetical protein